MMNQLIALNLREAYTIKPGGEPVANVYETPADLINTILPNIFVIVGVLLVIFIFVAGFMMVQNPDSSKVTEESRKKLTYAVLGFLLLFASYWIIQIVELYTGVTILGIDLGSSI